MGVEEEREREELPVESQTNLGIISTRSSHGSQGVAPRTQNSPPPPPPPPHFFGKTRERSNVVSLKSGAGQNGTSYVSSATRNSAILHSAFLCHSPSFFPNPLQPQGGTKVATLMNSELDFYL